LSTIPASEIVEVVPSVISAGGTGLNGIGLMLSNGNRVPLGTVASFPNTQAVASYFGAGSQHALEAAIYFAGFEGATIQPSALLCAEYNQTAAAAYLRGGPVTLAEMQAVTAGTLTIAVDGYPRNGTGINLSGAGSPSIAAGLIQTALNATPTTEASITGSITGGVLTVTNVALGTVAAGLTLNGTGVLSGTVIQSQLTGASGGTGTYQVTPNQSSGGTGAMTCTPTPVAVTYDSISGALQITSGITGAISTIAFATGTAATALFLTSATGAVLSQGAAVASVAAFMNNLIVVNSNWVNFMTLFDPDNGSGNTQKQAFAAWKNTALGGNRFGYVCWDPDSSPAASAQATTSLGYILTNNGDSGTCLIWEGGATQDTGLAAFILGSAASINFQQTNGRITFAFKAQAGLTANVTDPTTAANLEANGYNFYGAYGAANENFIWFQTGRVTGPFEWFDSYQDQIALNTAFQIALLTLLQNALSVPFSTAGAGLIQAACQTVIQQFLTFGAFAPGTISSAEAAEVNSMAGGNISNTLQSQGYYLQVNQPPATVRAARGPWFLTFFYLDRGSVQSITMSSVELQ
jgi:hypothetical protein